MKRRWCFDSNLTLAPKLFPSTPLTVSGEWPCSRHEGGVRRESGCYLVVILGEPYEIADMFIDKNGNFLWSTETRKPWLKWTLVPIVIGRRGGILGSSQRAAQVRPGEWAGAWACGFVSQSEEFYLYSKSYKMSSIRGWLWNFELQQHMSPFNSSIQFPLLTLKSI